MKAESNLFHVFAIVCIWRNVSLNGIVHPQNMNIVFPVRQHHPGAATLTQGTLARGNSGAGTRRCKVMEFVNFILTCKNQLSSPYSPSCHSLRIFPLLRSVLEQECLHQSVLNVTTAKGIN